MKIWGRQGYRDVQHQVESYGSAETVAGAVVWTVLSTKMPITRTGTRFVAEPSESSD